MKTTKGVCNYAAEPGIAKPEALKPGMEERSKGIGEKAAETNAKV